MKVLWLRPTKPRDISVGRERVAELLAERGIDVTFQNASGFDALRAIRRATSEEFDVLVGTVRMGLYVGFPVATLLGKPLLADVTDPIEQISDLPRPLYRLLERYEYVALARADARTFVYESSYREARRRGLDGVRIENAVEYEAFHDPDPEAVEEARGILRESGVDPDRPIAIYLGGLAETYHVEEILEAARDRPDWQFVFVGDGELAERVVSAARSEENVAYPGSFDYRLMPGFLTHAEVGLCLVDAEQPLKILEYGAAGVPAVAARGELEERFSPEEVVFVEPNPGEIASALDELGDDPAMASAYAEALERRAAGCRWRDVADAYEQILNDIA